MINIKAQVMALIMILFLVPLTKIHAMEADEAIEAVKKLREILAYEPGAPTGTEISAADIEQRKAEIRAEITAILQSTREPYSSDNIDVQDYIPSKGVLVVKDTKTGITRRITMSAAEGTDVTLNPGNYHLEAWRELDENFAWKYHTWTLKGDRYVYPEEPELEIINNIPDTEPLTGGPDQTDIKVYQIARDEPAQEAIEAFESRDFSASLDYFEAAVEQDEEAEPEYYYWIALNYIALGEDYRPTALRWLKRYLDSGNATYAEEAARQYLILSGQDMIFTYSRVQRFPARLATPNGERHFVVSPDLEWLYFSAYSKSNPDQLDIWRSRRINNEWDNPSPVSELNTARDEALCSFSNGGALAWLMGKYDAGKSDYDIHTSVWGLGGWQYPQPAETLSSPGQDIDPWVWDDKLIFFSSNRGGGAGGFDLYYSRWQNGAWSAPANLAALNTAYNETAPFLDWDGRTLYYCSDAPSGLGGSDIYSVVILDPGLTSWSLPTNLGTPVNSYFNEYRYYHRYNSNEAMIISDRGESAVPNMYYSYFELPQRGGYYLRGANGQPVWTWHTDEISPLTGTKPVYRIKLPDLALFGKVADTKGKPIATGFTVFWIEGGSDRRTIVRSKADGTYSVTLPRADYYTLECGLDGYHRYMDVITPFADEYEKEHDLILSPLEIDKPIVLDNIYFVFDSHEILERSEPSLYNTYLTLLDNPGIKVEIAGHTSNEGSDKYNLKLSKERAQAVVDFLVKQKIDPTRLKAVGYGENKPLNDNSTEEKREVNRRVEFTVIK